MKRSAFRGSRVGASDQWGYPDSRSKTLKSRALISGWVAGAGLSGAKEAPGFHSCVAPTPATRKTKADEAPIYRVHPSRVRPNECREWRGNSVCGRQVWAGQTDSLLSSASRDHSSTASCRFGFFTMVAIKSHASAGVICRQQAVGLGFACARTAHFAAKTSISSPLAGLRRVTSASSQLPPSCFHAVFQKVGTC